MTTFKQAINAQPTTTTNGMKALTGTNDLCLNLFYQIGASRGKNLHSEFKKALEENTELAIRILLWSRDVRGGAGERQIFRSLMKLALLKLKPAQQKAFIEAISEIGRWDDVLEINVPEQPELRKMALDLISRALKIEQNGLCAKWMPRPSQSPIANEIRKHLKMTPSAYRKLLVDLTKVVETQMCAQDWDNIEFGKVPSLAHARYKAAFDRNAPEAYGKYKEALVDGTAKINAGAVYPYDVLKNSFGWNPDSNADVVNAQWEALPNYMTNGNVLPMVDVSGSMTMGKVSSLTYLQIAVSLGLYCATKTEGPFKDVFLTFSATPTLEVLEGENITDKLQQMENSHWGYSTDIDKALRLVIETAVANKVSNEDMPKYLVIFSDMQFNGSGSKNVQEITKKQFTKHGYDVPNIVFWNLNHCGNFPATSQEEGMAMVSGFSPALMKSILAAEEFNPKAVMLDTVMVDRYNIFAEF